MAPCRPLPMRRPVPLPAGAILIAPPVRSPHMWGVRDEVYIYNTHGNPKIGRKARRVNAKRARRAVKRGPKKNATRSVRQATTSWF